MSDRLAKYAKELLYHAMHDYSEDNYCASWLTNLEYCLWDFIQGEELETTFLCNWYDPVEFRDKLTELSEDAGGWYYYCKDKDDYGPKFIEMQDWIKMVEERSATNGDS